MDERCDWCGAPLDHPTHNATLCAEEARAFADAMQAGTEGLREQLEPQAFEV